MKSYRPVELISLFSMLFVLGSNHGFAEQPMIQLTWRNQKMEGMPLIWSSEQVFLLGRDGFLRTIDPDEVEDFKKSSDTFFSYSAAEMKASLLREFGDGYNVSSTGHFLVVHPATRRDRWSRRFEELYRSFVHYMSVRGFEPRACQFPLVAIAFPHRNDFLRYAARDNVAVAEEMLGYYSPMTNRIVLFDVTNGDDDESAWQANATIIIHEATHQTAFNCGIHDRFAMPPRWVAEGLGTMFEAPGVYDSRKNISRVDRVNRQQLAAFQSFVAERRQPKSLLEFVSNDRAFTANTQDAYAQAWALTFFLSETEPRKYVEYLARTAAREPFREMRSPEVITEFLSVFGDDWTMLEARFLRFMKELK